MSVLRSTTLFLALSLSAFATPFATASADRTTVSVAAPWEIKSLDPSVSGFAFQRMQVMENLVDADASGRIRPGLATDWSASGDGLSWRFTLRNGVTFHDGTALDADAVAAALSRAAGKPGVLGKAPIDSIHADGDAVVIALHAPFAALPSLLAHSTTVIPAPAAFDAKGNPVAAIGTGPFRVEALSPPQRMVVVRYGEYWGEKPAISGASYLAAGRAETRALLAESGDADLVFTLDPAGYARLGDVGNVETMAVPIPRVVTLKLNAGHPFLAAPEARRALSLAIDRRAIAAGIVRFPDSAATQLFPPALGGWHRTDLAPLVHDPDEARRLLAGLGWVAGGDGVLERDGERFTVLLRTFPDRPELPLIAAALQDQWRTVGVEIEVSVNSYTEIPAGHQDGSLHVALYARNYGLTPDPIGTVLADFGTGGGDWGAMGWENPAVAAGLADIAATADPGARAPRIATVVEALHRDLPVIPILWYQHTVAVAAGLDGVVVDPLERSYGLSRISWAH